MKITKLLIIGFALSIAFASCKKEDENNYNIYNGSSIAFAKADSSDWKLEVNQDRINGTVWITRADNKGIFNINTDTVYAGDDINGIDPRGTKWAYGSTEDIEDLTFRTWARTMGGLPQNMIGRNMVLYLEGEDAYVDIKFTSWTSGGQGGGFSYTRKTK